MILKTQDVYDSGVIDENPGWLPEMFVCRKCNPEQLYFVTDPIQREHELCFGCLKEEGVI